jgi:hypothetical protein
VTHLYVYREPVKRALKIEDQFDDEFIDRVCRAATYLVDEFTERRFQPFTATRTVQTVKSDSVLLKTDVLSIGTLKTDDGTATYPNEWDADEFYLGPEEEIFRSPPHPYWKLYRVTGSTYSFPTSPRGVKLEDALCGFYDVRETLVATLAAAVTTTTTPTVSVSSLTEFEIGQSIYLDSEQMEVRAETPGSPATLTVTRGVNGTTAATHLITAPIQLFKYPLVDDAAFILAQRYLRRVQDAPLGIVGTIDGAMRLHINDSDVLALIGKLRRQSP